MTPDREAFTTHSNYIRCINRLMARAQLIYKRRLDTSKPTPNLYEKMNLVSLTKKSLDSEHEIVLLDPSYSEASTSWLPVKSYYLLYNLILTIDYLITLDKLSFRSTHGGCIKRFTKKLTDCDIEFTEPLLNQVFDQSILTYKSPAGSNLSSYTSDEEMYKLAMRKIAHYKAEDWKYQNKINLRKKKDKDAYLNYLSSFTVTIFDFIYYMRIRANYRDFAFIDGISPTETSQYFQIYYKFTCHFYDALSYLITNMAATRAS